MRLVDPGPLRRVQSVSVDNVEGLIMGSTSMGSARIFFVENVMFGVQTDPFGKIMMDFWRSRKHLYVPDLLKAKKSSVRSTFFRG